MRDLLREALDRAGLRPRPARIPYLRALVLHRGEYERSLLVAEIGEEMWRSGLAGLSTGDPGRAAVSALGHGSLLAEFAMAVIHNQDGERIGSLGARANLIVTAYDNLLDQGLSPEKILNDDLSPAEENPWIGAMVQSYFRLLGERRNAVLDTAIRRMYSAEKATAAGAQNPGVWRRKVALPFVVLGLGGCGFAHRAWLYRAGLVMGWIDDVVDSESDARLNRWNRFDGEARITRITRLGQHVMQWWDHHAQRKDYRDAFLYCLNTWTFPRTR